MPDYERDLGEIKAAIAEMRVELKSVWKRIDEQHKLAESVHELALAARDMAGEIKRQGEVQENQQRALDNQQRALDALKERPAKRWDAIVGAGIGAVVAAFVGWLMG